MLMLLTTLWTPLTSVTSLVTRAFSASFLAWPLTVTTPSLVVILVLSMLVERCDSNDPLTWAVIDASSIFSPDVSPRVSRLADTTISFCTPFTPSMSLAYSVVRSFWAWLAATPFNVTMPSFTYTSVLVPLTLRRYSSAAFTFMLIHVSELSAGWSPTTVIRLSTLVTPGNAVAVSWAIGLWVSLYTSPDKVTAPSLELILMCSSFRYVL